MEGGGDGVNGMDGLVKLIVNVTPDAQAALELAEVVTGDSQTDTVCRALLLYAEVIGARRGTSFTFTQTNGFDRKVTIE
jgi:hypothetical protein